LVLSVFCIFSGWDVVGALATHNALNGAPGFEWWAGAFQYSSTITLALWVPNHAIPGWILATLLLLWDTGRIRIGVVMMGAALSILWSPFALMGAVPFLAKAGFEALRRGPIWADVAMSAALAMAAVPLARFLLTDSERIPHGFEPITPLFAALYTLFIVVELGPALAINAIAPTRQGGFSKSTYLLAVASLLLIPFFRMGAANDLVMRASIPALGVLAITTGHSTYVILKERVRWKIGVTSIALALGLATGASELWLILRAPNTGISRCDLIESWEQFPGPPTPKTHYLVDLAHTSFPVRKDSVKIYPTGPTKARCVDETL
jgi:hypothetical protein